MKVTAEVEIACSLAASDAQRRRHDLMTVEHLLFALLHDEHIAHVVTQSGGDVDRLKGELEEILKNSSSASPESAR